MQLGRNAGKGRARIVSQVCIGASTAESRAGTKYEKDRASLFPLHACAPRILWSAASSCYLVTA